MRASQVLEEGGSFSDFLGIHCGMEALQESDSDTVRAGGGALCAAREGDRIFECAMRCGDTVRMDSVVYY